MSKTKYEVLDNRTGYNEGEIVELTLDELNNMPFNVHLRKIEVIDEKEILEKKKVEEESDQLRQELSDKGLSQKRIEEVLKQASSKKELVEKKDKIKIDDVTDDFLKNLDLNHDGVFDEKDVSIGAKAMRKAQMLKKKKKEAE